MIDICLINWRTENFNTQQETNFRDNALYRNGLLIESSQLLKEPPTGLMLLAAIMEERGYSVEILDCTIINDPFEYIKKNAYKYRTIGLTALTNTFSSILKIISVIKSENPQSFIILGGPHVSFEYSNILSTNKNVDAICIAESEKSFPWLIELLLEKPFIDFVYANQNVESTFNNEQYLIEKMELINEKPKGIAFRQNKEFYESTQNNQIISTGFPETTDLPSLPLPARHLTSKIYSVADIIVNRGCPNQCSFCSRTKLFPKMRIRSVNQVMKEVDYILSGSNFKFINFYDNININHSYFNNFLNELINRPKMLPWGAELRADVLTEEETLKLQKSNCRVIATGIESASKEVLEINFKFQNPEKVFEGIALIKKAKIAVQAYFVIGLPGDNATYFQDTLEMVKSLPLERGIDKINFFVTTPYPGSDLSLNPNKYGIEIYDYNFDNYNCENIILETPSLKKKDIKIMIQKAKELKESLGI